MCFFDIFPQPRVSRDLLVNWPSVANWSLDYLAKNHDIQLSFRLGSRKKYDQWETECHRVDAAISEFNSWISGSLSNMQDNPFKNYNTEDHYAYADYIYLKDKSELSWIQSYCPWKDLFTNVECENSTFWLGSEGSYTRLHYDTYGVNYVVQLFGRKRWILFAPEMSSYLYPTRVPLEESTVFSKIDLNLPNLIEFPEFSNAKGYEVVLNPGDLLFIPRHWWHYVKCLDDSAASINMWMDLPLLDNEIRLTECLTQYIAFSFIDSDIDLTYNRKALLHKEENNMVENSVWTNELIDLLKHLLSNRNAFKNVNTKDSFVESCISTDILWEELHPFVCEAPKVESEYNQKQLSKEDILWAITSPNVIELIKLNLESLNI